MKHIQQAGMNHASPFYGGGYILPHKEKALKSLNFRAFSFICFLEEAVRTGLEPVTPCVTGMYSNQLN